MRTALIAIAKNEGLYIREWLDYHLNMGFDKIIVADNDDQLVLSALSSPNVVIEDYTGVQGVQSKAYAALFQKYRPYYDWILFCDIDEFLVIEDGRDVNAFLSAFPQDADEIRLNCKHFTDNEELDVIDGDYRVVERFKTPIEVNEDRYCKSFISTKIVEEAKVRGHGIYNKHLKCLNALGKPCGYERMTSEALHKVAWINHYRTKTIGEYIRQKYYRGGANNNPDRYTNWQFYFFKTNTKTQEKIDYAKKIICSGDKI